jgi:hypothetical protein
MRKLNKILFLLLLLSCISSIFSLALAHTPLGPSDEIHSFETAFDVPNPTKSWALYRELHDEGEAEFFKLHLNAGERLRLNLFIKENKEVFAPQLIIVEKDLTDQDSLPSFIDLPEGYGGRLVEPEMAKTPEYEPFTPTSYFYLADVDETTPTEGEYYVIVYEPNLNEGKYGIAIGYKEEFTISEWLLIPFDVIGIHQWEGQSLILIIAPLLLTLVFGLALLAWKSLIKLNIFTIVGILAGLLYVGTGFMLFLQMFMAIYGSTFNSLAILTVVFGALPIILGFVLLRKIIQFKGQLKTTDRIILAFLGFAGLFVWSGLLLGPVLVIVASVLPKKAFKKNP